MFFEDFIMLLLKSQVSIQWKHKNLEIFYTQIAFQLSLNCSLTDEQNCYIISVVNARGTKSYNHIQRKDLGLQTKFVNKYVFIIYVFKSDIFFKVYFSTFVNFLSYVSVKNYLKPDSTPVKVSSR